MTEYAHHPDFRAAVETEMETFAQKIDEGLQWVSEQWEKCVMDSNWGWLSPGLKGAYELAKNKCEDKMNCRTIAVTQDIAVASQPALLCLNQPQMLDIDLRDKEWHVRVHSMR